MKFIALLLTVLCCSSSLIIQGREKLDSTTITIQVQHINQAALPTLANTLAQLAINSRVEVAVEQSRFLRLTGPTQAVENIKRLVEEYIDVPTPHETITVRRS